METPGTYYRGNRVSIVELSGKYAWIRFPDSENSRKGAYLGSYGC